ncbi:MAG: glycosyltransferase family 4 protein [Minisyncoccota bacterium]
MANKRVLIFSIAYYPLVGGAEVAVKETTDRLKDIEFDMITLRFNDNHKKEERLGNINIYRIGGSKMFFPFRAFLVAMRLHKKRKYTYVWSIMANWAGLAATFFKHKYPEVKYILTLQEGDSLEYIKKKVWLIYPLFKKIFVRADTVHAISNFLARWAMSMGVRTKVGVIPNGVDYKKFEGDHAQDNKQYDKNIILITTSRLVEKNGVADVIEAMKLLPEEVKFKIIGDGALLTTLSNRVKELNLESRVKFLGYLNQDEIPPHLHASHIFIRPSLSEGMGNSFIEAMAAGLPVIATPVGGIPDFLSDPDKDKSRPPTGLFVAVKDPRGIARQVTRLIKNENLRNTLVANGKRLAKEKYDWDLIALEMKSKVFNV